MILAGNVGFEAPLNGLYKHSQTWANGSPVYEKPGTLWGRSALYRRFEGEWVATAKAGDIATGKGAIISSRPADLPSEVDLTWQTFDEGLTRLILFDRDLDDGTTCVEVRWDGRPAVALTRRLIPRACAVIANLSSPPPCPCDRTPTGPCSRPAYCCSAGTAGARGT